jgi:glycerol-3-phosphate dehydrogenase (NAD(P)+)
MRIGYLGVGCWGYCLASILACKGYSVICWTKQKELAKQLNEGKSHPFFPGHVSNKNLHFTTQLIEALEDIDLLVESVTSAGIRPVFEQVKTISLPSCPIVVTSKGIEQNSGLILPQVVVEVLGESIRPQVGVLSGPGYAEEVIRGLPTSVVASAYDPEVIKFICDVFTTDSFRVYPNPDLKGVSLGGALKNIIAIACGIAEGLSLGSSARAALITRGLHEIRKLAVALSCKADTLNGLSGMGDLCMTCSSSISRNFRFGELIAKNLTIAQAQERIKTVVEGSYTCVSALQLSKRYHIPMPITEAVYNIIYKGLKPQDAVLVLMKRPIKEEHQ